MWKNNAEHSSVIATVTAAGVLAATLGLAGCANRAPANSDGLGQSTLHRRIAATVFWVGEASGPDNAYIPNDVSAWDENWVENFGGIDDPNDRCGDLPCGFTPKENPFYFALPFNDLDANGDPKPDTILSLVPWKKEPKQSRRSPSILKNRWIQVTANGKTVYAQWEDVGPMYENDEAYVFGNRMSKFKKSGIDLSPAVAGYLEMGGSGVVDWEFVNTNDVPDGPWKKTVTTS